MQEVKDEVQAPYIYTDGKMGTAFSSLKCTVYMGPDPKGLASEKNPIGFGGAVY